MLAVSWCSRLRYPPGRTSELETKSKEENLKGALANKPDWDGSAIPDKSHRSRTTPIGTNFRRLLLSLLSFQSIWTSFQVPLWSSMSTTRDNGRVSLSIADTTLNMADDGASKPTLIPSFIVNGILLASSRSCNRVPRWRPLPCTWSVHAQKSLMPNLEGSSGT